MLSDVILDTSGSKLYSLFIFVSRARLISVYPPFVVFRRENESIVVFTCPMFERLQAEI